jgi:hypothetical protein
MASKKEQNLFEALEMFELIPVLFETCILKNSNGSNISELVDDYVKSTTELAKQLLPISKKLDIISGKVNLSQSLKSMQSTMVDIKIIMTMISATSANLSAFVSDLFNPGLKFVKEWIDSAISIKTAQVLIDNKTFWINSKIQDYRRVMQSEYMERIKEIKSTLADTDHHSHMVL